MWTPLNFNGKSKVKNWWRYLQGDPRYRIWTRLVNWVRRYVRWRSNRFFFFSVSWIFPGKVECHIFFVWNELYNHKIWSNSFELFFRKQKFSILFLCELPLILRVGRKQKYGLEIFSSGPYRPISNFNEIDQLVRFRPFVRRIKKN